MLRFFRDQSAFTLPAFELINPGQNFRDRGIQRGRDLLTNITVPVKRTCQRRRFQHRNFVFGTQFFDAQRHVARTFRQNFWRTHFVFAVLQRHRVVRRVGDNHVGLRHIGHHPAAGHRTLLLADTPFNVRVTFLTFMFVADVLLAHAQFLQVAPDLPEHVERHHRRQPEDHHQPAKCHHAQRFAERGNGRLGNQSQHFRPLMPQV